MRHERTIRWSAVACSTMLPAQAWAHEGADHVTPEHIWSAWSFEPVVVLALTISGVLYLSGLLRMKQRPSGMQILSFAAGWLAMMLTLLSPIHRLGSELFSAHMAQHELLMLIAAPLLVLGRLGVVMLWALPIEIRGRLGAWAKARPVAASWAAISAPAAAWLIHGATLWLWHLPALYQATLESEWVHAAQHSTFLFTALLFWWTLIHGRGGRMSYGAAVAYIFTTAVHTSVLGALLTCSSQLWYPIYDGRTMAFGLTALQDQQLGGLIMWVPAGLVYIAIGLWLFAGWLRESEKRLVYSRSAELARLSSATGGRDA